MPKAELSKSNLKDGIKMYKAEKIFTDREEPRKVFWNTYNKLNEDLESYKIISYYGIGGLGKTSLIEKLIDEMKEKKKEYVSLNFEYSESLSKILILRELGKKLFDLDKNSFKFYRFRIALKRYSEETSQSIEIENDTCSFLSSNPVCDLALELAENVPDILEKAPIVSTISKIISILNKSISVVKKSIDTRNMKESLLKIRDYEQMSKLIDDLQVYFYEDLAEGMIRFNKPLVIFLDTYEKFSNYYASNDFQSNEDWFKSIISKPQGILWVIAGRERLKWEEKYELDQHLLENLSFKDARDFLITAGMKESLIEGIYKLTEGNPVFLDICIDTNTDFINQGFSPELSDFGENQAKLIERHSKYMDNDVKELAYLLAYMGKWTTEEIFKIKESTNIIKISVTEYNTFIEHSFIIKDNDSYYMTNIVRMAFYDNIPKELKNEFNKILNQRIKEKIEKKKNSIEIIEEKIIYTNNFLNKNIEPNIENLKKYDDIRKNTYELLEKGLYKEAINQFNTLYHYFYKKDNLYFEFKLKANYDRAYILNFIGEYKKAIGYLSTNLSINKEKYGWYSKEVSYNLKELGKNYYNDKQYSLALSNYFMVYDINKNVYGEDSLETIISFEDTLLSNYFPFQYLDNTFEKIKLNISEDLIKKAIWHNYGIKNIDLNKESGLKAVEEIYNYKIKCLNITNDEIIKTSKLLGHILSSQYRKGNIEIAGKLYEIKENAKKMYEDSEKKYGTNDKKTLDLYEFLCDTYTNISSRKGIKKYIKLYNRCIKIYGASHYKTLKILNKITKEYTKQWKIIKLNKMYKKLCKTYKDIYGNYYEKKLNKDFPEVFSMNVATEQSIVDHGKIKGWFAYHTFMPFAQFLKGLSFVDHDYNINKDIKKYLK